MKIKEVPKAMFMPSIALPVKKAYEYVGVATTPENFKMVCENLYNEIIKRIPSADGKDIETAIDNGVMMSYGDYRTLNVVTFFGFIKAFYSANKTTQNFQRDIPEEPRPQWSMDTSIAVFIERHNHNYVDDRGLLLPKAIMFDPISTTNYLIEKGYIEEDEVDRRVPEAINEMKADAEAKYLRGSSTAREMASFLKALNPNSRDTYARACQLALDTFADNIQDPWKTFPQADRMAWEDFKLKAQINVK